MTTAQRIEAVRGAISELQEAQVRAALCVSRLQELTTVDFGVDANSGIALPIVDELSLCVRWKKQSCFLGQTTSFRLLFRLVRRANQYVSYNNLEREVWGGNTRSDDTLRSAIRQLKIKLKTARMSVLANAIRGHGKHYGLILTRRRE